MATDKRDRQRQNRAVKQAEVDKQKRKQRWITRFKRLATFTVMFVIFLIVADLIVG